MEGIPVVQISGRKRIVFCSDMHLTSQDAATAAFFSSSLQSVLVQTVHSLEHQCLVLLGDVFERWVGDDDDSDDTANTFLRQLRRLQSAGLEVRIMHGNRDFLLGKPEGKAHKANKNPLFDFLPDPCVMQADWRLPHSRSADSSSRICLTHGDLLCTDDVDYQAFRNMVRQDAWQTQFLAKPLAQRQAIAEQIRTESQRKQKHGADNASWMEATSDAIEALFTKAAKADTTTLLHGHTHQPATHPHLRGERWVLSDWFYPTALTNGTAHKSARGDFIEWTASGLRRIQASEIGST